MASDANDPSARRRRIVEKGSDRLALITAGRAPPSFTSVGGGHSSNASCPPSLDQILPTDKDTGMNAFHYIYKHENKGKLLHKSNSTKTGASTTFHTASKNAQTSDLKIYLYKIVSPNQLRPAILASQDTRRKCSFFAGIVALLSHMGFPILGSYIIRSIILSRPLLLLLLINITITIGPLLLDALKFIQQDATFGVSTSEEVDLPDRLGSPFEWGILLKTGLSAFFMDSCIYSVVVVCGISILQKLGL
ncbi:hypothetical protein Tco_1291897 [Tanacetum coccineum]